MSHTPRLIAGAMSGTSADGVDVAIVHVTGAGTEMSARLIHHHARPYPAELKSQIFTLRNHGGITSLKDLARLARSISLEYAHAVNECLTAAGLQAADLTAIAAHGQTLFHDPPDTIQWLDPALLAAQTRCTVVSDFRRADCAADGQGAPLVPFADYVLFRHPTRNRVLLNIGGIANLTFIPAGAAIDQLIAFDTGPGNCISDHLCQTNEPTGPGYDPAGARASKGQPLQHAVARFLESDYFQAPPPKSTDGPAMIALFRQIVEAVAPTAKLEDLLATAALLTGNTILRALTTLPDPVHEILITGGGTENRAIMRPLHSLLTASNITLLDPQQLGVPSQAKEALAFALLAAATLDNLPSNVPSCTGATRQVVLGSITPRP
jgi:anhydro-N-acetylmuramic acid kinase